MLKCYAELREHPHWTQHSSKGKKGTKTVLGLYWFQGIISAALQRHLLLQTITLTLYPGHYSSSAVIHKPGLIDHEMLNDLEHCALYCCAIKALERSFIGDRGEQRTRLFPSSLLLFLPWKTQRLGYLTELLFSSCSVSLLKAGTVRHGNDIRIFKFSSLLKIHFISTKFANLREVSMHSLHARQIHFHSIPMQWSRFNTFKYYFSLSYWATISQP